MNKRIIGKVLLVLFFCIVPSAIVLYVSLSVLAGEKKYTLFPGRNIRTDTFGDYSERGGNSIINLFDATRERIALTYTLKSGYINPYAGFAVRSNGWINLEPFETMKIKIRSANSNSVRVFMFTKIPGYSKDYDFATYLLLQKEIALKSDKKEYTVGLADLNVPEWWYERELSKNDPRLKKDFAEVYSVSIQSGITQPNDIIDTVTVEEISFYKSNRTLFVIPIFLSILYSCAIFSFFRVRHNKNKLKKKINKVVLAYRDFSPDRGYDEEARKIIEYIGENYSMHELTVDTVSSACGISEMKIPQYLKKYFDLSFPQYLNAIRLAESKRLLKETDLMISEIAFRIGFNSISHFNRIFKDNEKISPKDFRKK